MGVILILLDGAQNSDFAALPRLGKPLGLLRNTPAGLQPESLCCIMHILGVPPEAMPRGRAYLEALAVGMPVEEDDLLLRCNRVAVDGGMLVSSQNRETVHLPGLHHLESYKYLLRAPHGRPYLDSLVTHAPHEHIGVPLSQLLPIAPEPLQGMLRELMLKHHLMPWSPAVKTDVPAFHQLHGIDGAAVAGAAIVRGIARAMGMHCPELAGATADVDTDLDEKARCAAALSRDYPLVLLHLNGGDEAAHRRDAAQKAQFLRRANDEVLPYLLEHSDAALLCIADHATDGRGLHTDEPVQYHILRENKECERWLRRS